MVFMNKIYGHEHLSIQFSLNNFVDVLRTKYINWQIDQFVSEFSIWDWQELDE